MDPQSQYKEVGVVATLQGISAFRGEGSMRVDVYDDLEAWSERSQIRVSTGNELRSVSTAPNQSRVNDLPVECPPKLMDLASLNCGCVFLGGIP